MIHHLADRDTAKQTATCSVCGPTEMTRSKRSWICATRQRERMRAWMARHPDRRSGARSAHRLEWRDPELGDGLCAECGPTKIVAYGRGYACANGTTRRGQAEPNPYCPDCRDADRRIVPLVDGDCPVCSMTLNQQLAAGADLRRQIGRAGYHDGAEAGVPLVVGQWADPYKMPDYESAVPGWQTLGSRTPAGTGV